MTAHDALRAALAARTGTRSEDWFPVLKARYGMEVVFAALAAARGGGQVQTQALTCATAVNPILVAGLRPVYADIARGTLSVAPAPRGSTPAGGEEPVAVVVQHTFGFVADAEAADRAAAARAAGALVVEDCAHGVTRMARAADGMAVADVSVHSFGVEKVLPTKFGGAVWLSPDAADPALRGAIAAALGRLPGPGPWLRLALATYRVQVAVLSRLPQGASRAVRRMLVAARLHEPPVAPSETRATNGRRPVGLTAHYAALAVEALRGLEANEARRVEATRIYAKALADVALLDARAASQPLVRFPLAVPEGADAESLIAALGREGIAAGRWYRPLLFPGPADPAAYGLGDVEAELPVTADVAARIVNLPTHVSPERAAEIAAATSAALAAHSVGPAKG